MTRKIIVLFLLGVIPICAGQNKSYASDSCAAYSGISVPKFRIARTFTNRTAEATVLNISIAPTDASKEKAVALACKLGKDYSRARVLVVWVFDNYRSAKVFRAHGEGVSEATKRALRASYSFNRETNSQGVTWTPDPRNPSSSVQIALGAPPP